MIYLETDRLILRDYVIEDLNDWRDGKMNTRVEYRLLKSEWML